MLIVPTNWAGSVQSWNQAKVSDDMEWGLAYLPSSEFGTAWKWGSKLNGKNLGTTLTSACENYSKVGANQFITGELDINDDAAWEAYVAGVKSQVDDFDGFFKTLNEKTDVSSLEYYK